ncbi:MAG: ATP-binding cassette domain-containing protein [Clostridia bacterium]|nr:ATP-binding cassette domain-containing protein [Clostridia bacterium]
MNEQNEVLLRVENLCQYFKMGRKVNKAVDNISFDIKKGEVFGLVGESGCGKTTTGRSIIKIYDITSGSIYFKGQRICAGTKSYQDAIQAARKELAELQKNGGDPARKAELEAQIEENRRELQRAKFDHQYSDREYARQLTEAVHTEYKAKLEAAKNSPRETAELKKKYKEELRVAKKTRLITKIQMIFQDPIASLNPRMTVREIISEGLVINGIRDQKYIDEKVYEILEMVGLVREHAGRYPHEFSGGQRQRIGIARSVIMKPDLLIADEPISALDVSIQAQVINLMNDLRDKLGLTILFIAHDLSVVKYFSDRIGVMYFGKMVELATSDELFAHPLHPYTKSLLSAIPLPDPRAEKNRTRITYNALAAHDYSTDLPSMREITPGHFVYCNNAEEQQYKKELGL